jgi:predicted site-specific integrase-resolvase
MTLRRWATDGRIGVWVLPSGQNRYCEPSVEAIEAGEPAPDPDPP